MCNINTCKRACVGVNTWWCQKVVLSISWERNNSVTASERLMTASSNTECEDQTLNTSLASPPWWSLRTRDRSSAVSSLVLIPTFFSIFFSCLSVIYPVTSVFWLDRRVSATFVQSVCHHLVSCLSSVRHQSSLVVIISWWHTRCLVMLFTSWVDQAFGPNWIPGYTLL